ncbi:anti-phage defense-associated sirtuin Dsr1 [Pseudomonas sp. KB_12]|uniref:anti-phage defense-associated sirtuin Dsr1 n=1 Tax=Pseudomonas sp. KB_12 TaxID=3233034 RepID=UPI003F980D11
MQFVTDGPDIPDELLQAHEEGRVVFFCGAGISYPAGLTDFKGLVELIYKEAHDELSGAEEKAFKNYQFDATLDLLERRINGGRFAVRQALGRALKPNLRKKGAVDTHTALLRLARTRHGTLRLVTTNFDRIFDTAARKASQKFQSYSAPMLPIPKNSRWDGLVYLHGILPKTPDEASLNRLVVTSGDFGLAYLVERWAARFVSELFRNYVVCFVGYSINDPVLRYMRDAIAADRMQGEITPNAWAFGSSSPGEEEARQEEWEAKGVTPILYNVPAGTRDHSALHLTLQAWGEVYRDGVMGKERFIVTHAQSRPSASTRQDDYVGRVLWALSDKSGLPARLFADFDPVPSLDWLDAFAYSRYRHTDLNRFGVTAQSEPDAKLEFSLVQRPTPYPLASSMSLVSASDPNSQWDDVMGHIGRWLVRHLDNPDLLLWIVERGGRIHDQFRWRIEDRLRFLARLKSEGQTPELGEILRNAPKAQPSHLMQTLWRLLLTGRVKQPWRDSTLYDWQERFKRDGLTLSARLQLRELLAPMIAISKPFSWEEDPNQTSVPGNMRDLVDWKLTLAADGIYSIFRDFKSDQWKVALPLLQKDLQQLLTDALELRRELGEAGNETDRTHWDLPSIAPHDQNRRNRDWVILVELLRDSWLLIRDENIPLARQIAQEWFALPFATYKRLALFAASHDSCIAPDEWVDWLLADDAWWLWSVGTKREMFRLIVLQGHLMSPSAQARLEAAILEGAPRRMYKNDLKPQQWKNIVDGTVWRRLAKLQSSGISLGTGAMSRLTDLSRAYPAWRLASNESDEFSNWMGTNDEPDDDETKNIDVAPSKRNELVRWLKAPPSESWDYEDTWRETCRRHPLNAVFALLDLAEEKIWPANRWRQAIQTWGEKGRTKRSWQYAAPWILTLPDFLLAEIVHSITYWIDAVSKVISQDEPILLELCGRIMALPLEPKSGITSNGEPLNDPVTDAINHPIGHITQALLNLWLGKQPNDNDSLPTQIKDLFTALCDTTIEKYRHGRVILGSRLIVLFRVDRPWTESCLLPLFDWVNYPFEAKGVWEGFLWSPRLYRPLLLAFKTQFLNTAKHFEELGEHAQQFAAFLTYAALGPLEGYTAIEFRSAFKELPKRGLEYAAQALTQALEGAAEQKESYWENRVLPFWRDVWPKSKQLVTPAISDSLASLAIVSGTEFPAALASVQDWLLPIEHPHSLLHEMNESSVCTDYPAEALLLLSLTIEDQSWIPSDLTSCLSKIVQAAPNLSDDDKYRKLMEGVRRRGG